MVRAVHYAMRRFCHRCGTMKGLVKHEQVCVSRLEGDTDKRRVLTTYREVLACGHEQTTSTVEFRCIF